MSSTTAAIHLSTVIKHQQRHGEAGIQAEQHLWPSVSVYTSFKKTIHLLVYTFMCLTGAFRSCARPQWQIKIKKTVNASMWKKESLKLF